MDDDSSAKMQVIPLVLIILILVLVLSIRPPVISLRTDNTKRTATSLGGSQREIHEEEEPLLSHVEDALLSQHAQVQCTKDTFSRLTAEIDHWKSADASKTEEINIARQSVAKLQQDLSTSVSQNAELKRRCETLSRDLEGARLFLNTADPFADSEVIQILQKLNTELQHISTFMADRVVSVYRLDAVTSGPEQQIMVDRASESVGPTLVQFLRIARCDNSEVPMYLQIAFQAYLTYHLCWIVSSWALDQGHSAFIAETYQRLRETEKQTISGRWRSLMRAYAFPTCVSNPSSLVKPIIEGLSHILLAVGCAATQPDVMSELSSMLEKKILSTITLAGRLNQMMGTVVSGDFEVFVVRPGDAFHKGTMEEDTDGDGDNVQGAEMAVLCTSELGLTKRVQLGTGEKETKMVIKAKVILESFLDAEN